MRQGLRDMGIALAMGFYSGLPLLLTGSVLQAWMTERGMSLATVGLFALTGLPYTLKFLWAPLFDRYQLPGFRGRRRGWLLLLQCLLALVLAAFAMLGQALTPLLLAGLAFMVSLLSASQDILIDAYRRENLAERALALGASFYVNGYRLGMLLASGGGLILADQHGFAVVYGLMAGIMATGLLVTWLVPEQPAPDDRPATLQAAVIQPFLAFFARRDAAWILAFILLYKLGDAMGSQMTMPFYLTVGYTKTEIGAVVKLFGFWATLLGGLAGGILVLRSGIFRALWLCGILQAVSTLGFNLLATGGTDIARLAAVISFENLTSGMGTSAFVAFMASQTDRRFTATQYALLSSLMGIPRVLVAAPSGWIADSLGWPHYFILCAALALPGLLVLLRFRSWLLPVTAEAVNRE
jgi:PAT family beta-lactamase induction signal transducer AmpG